LWVVLIITGVLLWQVVSRTQWNRKDKDFSTFSTIEKGSVENVEITGSEVKGKFKDGTSFKTTMPNYPEFFKTLIAKGVTFKVKEPTQSPWLTALISS
jgi:cell division protease FtsH